MEKLVRQAKENKEEAKLEIIERLKPLIYTYIRKYRNFNDDLEDLYQDGVLEILKIIEDYDFNKGVRFLGYAKLRLRYFYLDRLKYTISREMESLNSKYKDTDLEKIDLIVDTRVDIEARIISLDENIELYRAYEKLTKREREVIDYYYIKGLSMVEISEKLGLAYRTVINNKANGIKRLQKYFFN